LKNASKFTKNSLTPQNAYEYFLFIQKKFSIPWFIPKVIYQPKKNHLFIFLIQQSSFPQNRKFPHFIKHARNRRNITFHSWHSNNSAEFPLKTKEAEKSFNLISKQEKINFYSYVKLLIDSRQSLFIQLLIQFLSNADKHFDGCGKNIQHQFSFLMCSTTEISWTRYDIC